MKPIKISPSLMCADLLHLEEELRLFEEYDVDLLHIDVMDGHYAPNYALGIGFCVACQDASSIPLDVHLMIDRAADHAELFCYEGAHVTFHPEVCRHPVRTIDAIRQRDAKPGIALDPAHSIETYRHLLPLVDLVCVMTVNPGFAGQSLLPFCINKIRELREYAEENELDFEIEVDGNVSWENIPRMVDAGANVLVAGTSSLFSNGPTRRESLERLFSLVESVTADGADQIERPSKNSAR